jgi:DnaJ homolog subfamily B member 4
MFSFFVNDINQIFNLGNKKLLNIEKIVNLTLEEVYRGCEKEVSFVRKIKIRNKEFQSLERIKIQIPKGAENESVFLFEGFGDESNGVRGNLNLKIKLIPNSTFQRSGNDLIHTKSISLSESLLGFKFKLNHFGRDLLIDLSDEIVDPQFQKMFYSIILIH